MGFPWKKRYGEVSSRKLFTYEVYDFLQAFFSTCRCDPALEDEDIVRGDDGHDWVWPMGLRRPTGIVFNAGKMWISQAASFDFTASTTRTSAANPIATEANDMAYIRVPFDGSAPQWKDSSEYVDSDPTAEWYYVAETSGDIHVPRA